MWLMLLEKTTTFNSENMITSNVKEPDSSFIDAIGSTSSKKRKLEPQENKSLV